MTGAYPETIRYKKRAAPKIAPRKLKSFLSEMPTYHDGANDERTTILAKVRRMQREAPGMASLPLDKLEQWLLSRVKRNKGKAGGL